MINDRLTFGLGAEQAKYILADAAISAWQNDDRDWQVWFVLKDTPIKLQFKFDWGFGRFKILDLQDGENYPRVVATVKPNESTPNITRANIVKMLAWLEKDFVQKCRARYGLES
jgi:hypothetical protein